MSPEQVCASHTPWLRAGLCGSDSWGSAGSPKKPLNMFSQEASKFALQYAAFIGCTIVLTDVTFYHSVITLIRKEIR